MKTLWILLALLPFNALQYLSNINGFAHQSYFKQQAYSDNKKPEETAEANRLVNTESYDIHLMNWCLFKASEEVRNRHHAKQLQFSEALRNAAMIHSNEMVIHSFYNHINAKNSQLKTPEQRLHLFGISNVEMAENVHKFPFENNGVSYINLARAIVKDFYDSPNHRKNLLNKNFNSIGCAALWEFDKKESYYFLKVTQCFARL